MRTALAIACALIVLPSAAFAHHSAIRFDLTIRDRMVEGIVKEFNSLASRLGHEKGLKLSEVTGSPKARASS